VRERERERERKYNNNVCLILFFQSQQSQLTQIVPVPTDSTPSLLPTPAKSFSTVLKDKPMRRLAQPE
jgi:hypothetical protein